SCSIAPQVNSTPRRCTIPALYHLGRLYELGTYGTRTDARRAYELFREAANLGHVWAERQLAVAMARGVLGIGRIPCGLIRFLRVLVVAARLHWTDKHSERLVV